MLWDPHRDNTAPPPGTTYWTDGCRCWAMWQAGRRVIVKAGCPVHSAAPPGQLAPSSVPDRKRVVLAGGGAYDGGRYEVPAEMAALDLYDAYGAGHHYADTGRLDPRTGAHVFTYRRGTP